MTENEAIKTLKKDSCYECAQGADSPFSCEYGECRVAKANRAAIKALEEVQKYRAIGTPEECRAAVEKQKSFKPVKKKLVCGVGKCKCGVEFLDRKTNYCGNCGQKLNWNRRGNDETD